MWSFLCKVCALGAAVGAVAEPGIRHSVGDPPAEAADRAVALLALASAREAQLDEADQSYLKKLQHCKDGDCAQVVKEFQESKTSFRALEDQALTQAKQVLMATQAPNTPHPTLRSHVSKHSKAPAQPAQSNLHKLMAIAFGTSMMVAAFVSGRSLGDLSVAVVKPPVFIDLFVSCTRP